MRGQDHALANASQSVRITPADAGTSCATEGNEKRENLAINILLAILDTDCDWLLTKNERKIINKNLGDVNGKDEKGD